jgi:predicted nucleic acid-binding protein
MPVLIDTNILLRSLHADHPHHATAVSTVSGLRLKNEILCIAPQNLIEFWAIATCSRQDNGLGMTLAYATSELATLRRLFRLLPASPEILEVWRQLVTRHGVTGKQTHDAHRWQPCRCILLLVF